MKKRTQQRPKTVWGKQLIIDACGIQAEWLKDIPEIKKLLNHLVKRLKMKPLSKATVKKVRSGNYPDWGVSGFIMLYESHIAIHTWPEENYAAVDIYSCKDFCEKKALNYLQKIWPSSQIKSRVIIRE